MGLLLKPFCSKSGASWLDEKGVSLVELSFSISLILIFVIGTTDLGRALRTRQLLAEAARNGVRNAARYAAALPDGALDPRVGCVPLTEDIAPDPEGFQLVERRSGSETSQYDLYAPVENRLPRCSELFETFPVNLAEVVKKGICETLRAAHLEQSLDEIEIDPTLLSGKLEGDNWRYMNVVVRSRNSCIACSFYDGLVRAESSFPMPVPSSSLARCTNVQSF